MGETHRPYNWVIGLLDVATRGKMSGLARQKKERGEGFDAMAEELHRKLADARETQVDSRTPTPGTDRDSP